MLRLVSIFAALFIFANTVYAQEIPVTREDKNTFSFSTESYVLVNDFELLNAEPLEKQNHYLLTIRALSADKETDESVSGHLLFEVDGQPASIKFMKGLAQHEATIQNPNEFTVTAIDSKVSKTFQVAEPIQWYWVFMIIPALLVFYIIFRKINGKKRTAR